MEGKPQLCDQQRTGDGRVYANGNAWKAYSQGDDFRSSSSIPNSVSLEKSCTLPLSQEFHNFKEENFHQVHRHQRNELQLEVSGSSTQSMYPCYMSGIVNQVAVPSSGQLCQKNLHELPSHATLGMLPQYNHLQQCPPHMAGMTSIPYCPPSLCLQPGQISANQSWQSFGSSASPDVNLNKVDRREAALMKFRQKRKERCFHKKIRYVNRKKLAERRPRVRGQFVRKVNGVSVDLNGQPATADYDEHEEEDEDELTSRDSSPEDDASGS